MTAMATVQLGQLTPDEQTRLSDLEAAVARGMETFVEVGTALASIRDQRLYRATHATFEDYCRDRWAMSRIRAHQMIDAAATVEALTMVNTPPITSERQARAIAPVLKSEGPEAAAEVLRTAAESGPVTAKGIAEAAGNRAKVTETTRTTEATKVAELEIAAAMRRRADAIDTANCGCVALDPRAAALDAAIARGLFK